MEREHNTLVKSSFSELSMHLSRKWIFPPGVLHETPLSAKSIECHAFMGERAECVMLNKGPYVVEAVKTLDDILRRMAAHQEKKTSMLRKLRVDAGFGGTKSAADAHCNHA